MVQKYNSKDNMINKIKKSYHRGFTLIELVVGISIFMIMLAISVDFFISSLEMQQKALTSQQLLGNVSYSLEYMSRALRMAQKDSDGKCIAANNNYEYVSGKEETSIRFLNYQGRCQEFYWDDTGYPNTLRSIKVRFDSEEPLSLTSEFIDAVSFKIGPNTSWIPGDLSQPKVTLFFELKSMKNKKAELQPSIKIQTTVSQRSLGD